MAKMLGARVIGTVGSEEKAKQAKDAGADEVVIYTKEDFTARAKGMHVVYDSVGKTTFMQSLDCLRPRGMMVTFGNASGPVPDIPPLLLSQKGSLFLTRPSLAHYAATPEELAWRAGDVLNWIAQGKLKAPHPQGLSLCRRRPGAARSGRPPDHRKAVAGPVIPFGELKVDALLVSGLPNIRYLTRLHRQQRPAAGHPRRRRLCSPTRATPSRHPRNAPAR